MSDVTLNESDETGTRDLLVGRRIVAAESGDFTVPGREDSYYRDKASGRLTLDDGTQILVIPNEGGCACSAGDYDLAHLATVDNIITDVRLACESDDKDEPWDEPDRRYRIYVIADNVEVNVLSVDGNDGNGYYGTGYELFVVPS